MSHPQSPEAGASGADADHDRFSTMARAELRELIRDTARRLAFVRAEVAGLAAIQSWERTEEQEAELDLARRTDETWTAMLRDALASRRRRQTSVR